MGAIFGILGDAGSEELQQLGARLAHRGPEVAQWSLSSTVHLGVRGSQAAVREMKGSPVVFDGVLDNRTELLKHLGRQSQGGSNPDEDSEVIRELLERLGTESLQHAAGQFALAWWDSTRERLILARDRIGYAPLYFTVH